MRFISCILLFTLFGLITISTSCKKKIVFSSGSLNFSQDTVVFDTVFTTVGSTTQRFRIKNNNNSTLLVEEIQLMGGENSPFRINIDGISSLTHSNIEIPKKDSIYAFVEVNLNPNGGNLPLIIEDSIRFRTNGKDQYVNLAAWGQDAYFHRFADSIYQGTEIWPNDKPHVIYGAFPVINNGTKLIIQEGTDVYLHNKSQLIIYQAALEINGTAENRVTFQGDRLEAFYDNVSGQYNGINLFEAQSSSINHTVIKNGAVGVQVFKEDNANTDFTLRITNSEIYNNSFYGLYSFDGGSIYGENLIVHSNGFYSYFMLGRGNCYFKQSHFLGYGSESSPSVVLKNYYTGSDATLVSNIDANFYNCIIYGNNDNMIGFDTLNIASTPVDILFNFENNLIRQDDTLVGNSVSTNIWNQDPQFYNQNLKDFKITSSSPAKDGGSTNSTHTNFSDILGTPRVGIPDIGAYEL